jgi:hypothetical protein
MSLGRIVVPVAIAASLSASVITPQKVGWVGVRL